MPVGHLHLHIDPTNSPRPETFPELAFVTVAVAGQNNILGQPILLPALDMENSKIVGGNQDVTLTMRGVPGLAMTIFANSVQCPGGASTCRVTISQVHLDKVPMPPPNGNLFMPPAWTIQPHGVHFTKPARMTIPNNGLAPGRIIDMFQFDHDLNMFVNIGKGTVSQDGLTITTDPGFGISAAGWGGGGPPPPPTTCGDACKACNGEVCENGACVKKFPGCGSKCGPEGGDGRMCGLPCDCLGGTQGLTTSSDSCWAVPAPDGQLFCYTDFFNTNPDRTQDTCCTGGCGRSAPTGHVWRGGGQTGNYQCTRVAPCDPNTTKCIQFPIPK